MEFGTKRHNNFKEKKFLIEFIALYKKFPALWCLKSPDYVNRKKKLEAYKILLEKYKTIDENATIDEVKRKINILRTNYRREYNKVKAMRAPDGSEGYKPSLWYFNELNFLYDQIKVDRHKASSGKDINLESELWEPYNGETQTDCREQQTSSPTESVSIFPTCTVELQSPKRKKRKSKKSHIENELLSVTRELIKTPEDEFDIMAKSWAVKIRKMLPQQRLFAEKAINDVLFEGQMGTLHRQSVILSSVSNISTNVSSPPTFVRF